MAANSQLADKATEYIDALSGVEPDRRPAGAGNSQAADLVSEVLGDLGWDVATPRFACLDWRTSGGEVRLAGEVVGLTPSPYGLGVEATGRIRVVGSIEEITDDMEGAILVLTGSLASEPLTPKNFPFYSYPEHDRIIEALESAKPAVVIGVTGKYPALCGALDPFPVIEDGDFAVPAASVRPDDGVALVASEGEVASVSIKSERLESTAVNVVATRGDQRSRVTVAAHIDTKPGTPGAVDNATGVAVLLVLAELLTDETLSIGVELLAVNGEDHYAGPGEVAWLADNAGRLDDVCLMVNIDGAGYENGLSAYSTYNLSPEMLELVDRSFGSADGMVPGPEWYQSDHAIFAMQGRPAVAVTSERMEEMLETLFHAPTDTPERADPARVVEIADAVRTLLVSWPA